MKNRIIEEIMKKGIPQKVYSKVRRLNREEDIEDYIQDMYVLLMELPDNKLIGLYQRKELDKYFAKICLNQLSNNKSVTHQKYETYINKQDISNYEDRL